MTLAQFLALPPEHLPELVHAWGLYLGMCRRATDSVMLYRYPGPGRGFFVELYQSRATGEVLRMHAFATELPLEIDLALWTPAKPAPLN